MHASTASWSVTTGYGLEIRADRYDAGDVSQPQGLARMSELLAVEGLALFHGAHSRTAVVQAASKLLIARPHPDADPDGITVITDRGAAGDLPNGAGFSCHELTAHTDGSRDPNPPPLMMAVCAQPAATGGASRFADGLAVLSELATTCPQAMAAFALPRSVLFGGTDGYLGTVLTPVRGKTAATTRLQLRLRLDDLVNFSPDVQLWLPALRAAIARHIITVPLAAGQGYVLDNHRWLHAREQFTGMRALYRIIGDPLPGLTLHPGIPPTLDFLGLAGGGSHTSGDMLPVIRRRISGTPGSGPS